MLNSENLEENTNIKNTKINNINNNDIIYPSITKIINTYIIDEEIEKWKQEIGEEKADYISKKAMLEGNLFHNFIETYIIECINNNNETALLNAQKIIKEKINNIQNNSKIKINERNVYTLFYNVYYSFLKDDILKILNYETKLYSNKYYFNGIFDLNYISKNNKNIIIDFKSSSKKIEKDSIKEYKYKLQLIGYLLLYEENFNENIDDVYLLISLKNKENNIYFNELNENIQIININKNEYDKLKDDFIKLVLLFHKDNNQLNIYNEIINNIKII